MNKLSSGFKGLFTSCIRPRNVDRDDATPRPGSVPPHTPGLAGLAARRPPRLPVKAPRQLSATTAEYFEALTQRNRQVLESVPRSATIEQLQALVPTLRATRLEQARAMANVAEEDHFSGRQKNLVYAQLMRGTSMTLSAARASGMSRAQQFDLQALLLAGEHHNRWVHHVGGASQALPEHVHDGNNPRYAAQVTYDRPQRLTTTPKVKEAAGVVAHESVHEAQLVNRVAWFLHGDAFHSAQARFDTDTHDLALQLDLARRLPRLAREVSGPGHLPHYVTRPVEAQSFLEQQIASDLLPRDSDGVDLPPPTDESGLAIVAPLLAQAGRVLDETGAELSTKMRLTDPRVGRLMEHIVFDIAELSDIARSQAHRPAHGAQLARALEGLRSEGAPGSHEQGIARLEHIAAALRRAVDDAAPAGAARHVRAEAPALAPQARSARFTEAKHEPAVELARVLESVNAAPGTTYPQVTDPQAIAGLFEAARQDSGFVAAVQSMRSQPGVLPAPDRVRDAVVSLAATLMGLAPADFPAELLPAVHLYEAPSLEFERVPGFNAPPPRSTDASPPKAARATSHQKRKAGFDASTWQLHVPHHLFLDDAADRLQARLAGLAADLAYTATALLVQSTAEDVSDPKHRRRAGITYGSALSNAADAHEVLGHVGRDEPSRADDTLPAAYRQITRRIHDHVEANPDGVAALMRTVIRATPVRDEHALWHEGPRAMLKAEAHAGSDNARAAYEARTLDRWHQAPVALRRAVIGPRAASDAATATDSGTTVRRPRKR